VPSLLVLALSTRRTIRASTFSATSCAQSPATGPRRTNVVRGIGIVLVVGALLNYKSSGECAVGENRLHLDRWCELTADMEAGRGHYWRDCPKSGTPPGRCMGGTACGRTRLAGRWAAIGDGHPCRETKQGWAATILAELTR